MTATPRLLPAPTGLAATVEPNTLTVTWADPNDPTITCYQYRVTAREVTTTSIIPWTDIPGCKPATDPYSHKLTSTLLVNGTAYDYHLRAVTAVQTSAAAKVWATPVALPAAPDNLDAAVSDQKVTLSWDDPGNATITKWERRYKKADANTWGDWADASPAVNIVPNEFTFDSDNWNIAQNAVVSLSQTGCRRGDRLFPRRFGNHAVNAHLHA